jgi:hypothetical protein
MFRVRRRGWSRCLLGIWIDKCRDEHIKRTSVLVWEPLDLLEARLSVALVDVLNGPSS